MLKRTGLVGLVGAVSLAQPLDAAEATFDKEGTGHIECACVLATGAPEIGYATKWSDWWSATLPVTKGMKLDDRALAHACYKRRATQGNLCAEEKTETDSIAYYKGRAKD